MIRKLAVAVLDDAQGISEDAYTALLECLEEEDAKFLASHVEAIDGRFYLPENHQLNW